MQQIVGWLERPQKKVGLDNLGTQQPCVMIYSRLLPGVTNVTDRAAYFGFYPWFIRAFEVRYPDASDAAFTDALRRADCLMTLVAERHALVCGGDIGPHSATCPGRRKLGPLCQRMDAGEVAELTRYADKRDNNPTRYFKNSLGGLGQYYLGPLRDEYHVLHGDARRGVKYWEDRAIPLADAYGQGLDSDLFFAVLEATSVTAADLDDLAAFCPCSLQSDVRPAARDELLAFFLEDNTPNGLARRATFALLLNFLDTQSGVETDDAVKDFLAACYANCLRDGAWEVPAKLESTRRGWALYARNEMLSLAWLTLFKAALDELDGHPKPFRNVEELAAWLITQEALNYRPSAPFDGLVSEDLVQGPAQEQREHPAHELAYWGLLVRKNQPPVETAVRLLVRLVARCLDEEGNSYRDVALAPDTVASYPLNLNSLRRLARTEWSGQDAERWIRTLVSQALATHQRIAIRKMGQSGEDTLMFRSGDLGFFVHRRLEQIVETQPRLRQALQIQRDLGLTVWPPGRFPTLTDLGRRWLAEST